MPTINEMRTYLYSKYWGKKWKDKVDRMSETQVIAIWISFQKRSQEKLQKKEEQKRKKEEKKVVQLQLFDK